MKERKQDRYITYKRLYNLLNKHISNWDKSVTKAEDNLREDVPERFGVLALNQFLNDIKVMENSDGRFKGEEKQGEGEKKVNKILEVCPLCRFPSRISGHLFVTDPSIMKLRCPVCNHFPDYIVTNIEKRKARIIYRNFKGSEEYFEKVKRFLKDRRFKLIKRDNKQ
jgi:hypothetical protein